MNSNFCRRCAQAFTTVESVINILQNDWGRCGSCANSNVLEILTKQFRLRSPRWWVVDGAVIVPIWIVEKLKKHPELLTHWSAAPAGYSGLRLDTAAFQH